MPFTVQCLRQQPWLGTNFEAGISIICHLFFSSLFELCRKGPRRLHSHTRAPMNSGEGDTVIQLLAKRQEGIFRCLLVEVSLRAALEKLEVSALHPSRHALQRIPADYMQSTNWQRKSKGSRHMSYSMQASSSVNIAAYGDGLKLQD